MNFKFKLGLSLSLILLQFPKCNSQIFQFLKKADHIEISGGPSLVTLRMSDKVEQKKLTPKIGYAVRLGFDYNINKVVTFNVGVLYEGKGSKRRSIAYYYDPSIDSTNCKCTTSPGRYETNMSRDYLELSITTKFKIMKDFYISPGIFMGHLVKIKIIEKHFWNNSIFQYQYGGIGSNKGSVPPSSRRLDGGVNLSLAYSFKIGNIYPLFICINEFFGLLDIAKPATSGNKTNSLSFLISYPLKSK